MTDHELTHDRCSELLADFAAGELAADETLRVEAHLGACDECSAELRAIMALRAGDEPLTEIERVRLRGRIKVALGDVIPARRESRTRARLVTALGAAAVLAIFGVAVVALGTGGGDSDSGAAFSKGSGDDSGRAADTNTSGAGGAAAEAAAPLPRPTYERNAGTLSSKKLTRIGKHGPIRDFAAYSAADADVLQNEYVNDLADQAGTPVDSLILSCAEKVYEAQPYAALPAFAARGRLEGREALVLGFAWTDKTSGPLDRFMLWTWPQSSCDQPIDYRAGQIAPRK